MNYERLSLYLVIALILVVAIFIYFYISHYKPLVYRNKSLLSDSDSLRFQKEKNADLQARVEDLEDLLFECKQLGGLPADQLLENRVRVYKRRNEALEQSNKLLQALMEEETRERFRQQKVNDD